MSYLPQFKDANGMMFGLFSLDLYDDARHLFSGLWAGIAAWISTRAAVFYFKLFGTLYFLDGVLGLTTRILANLPHLAIGGFAAYVGFVLSKPHGETA